MPARVKILVACADRAIRQAVTRVIAAELPAEVREAGNGPDAYDQALAWLPDLVVLSTELPGYDGLQLCHRLRGVAQLMDTPIVALGARGDQARKYQAFYVGVNDYVELPFDGVEFAFRLRAPLRPRLRSEATDSITCGSLTLEPATRQAMVDGRKASLTPAEFAILRLLAAQGGKAVDTERLLVEALGQPRQLGNPQVVHTHMRNLRKKLEADPKAPRLLLRESTGYVLNA